MIKSEIKIGIPVTYWINGESSKSSRTVISSEPYKTGNKTVCKILGFGVVSISHLKPITNGISGLIKNSEKKITK